MVQIALNKAQHAESLSALLKLPGKGTVEKIAQSKEAIELPGPETHHPDTKKRHVVLSKRHEQLACPKKLPDGVR